MWEWIAVLSLCGGLVLGWPVGLWVASRIDRREHMRELARIRGAKR